MPPTTQRIVWLEQVSIYESHNNALADRYLVGADSDRRSCEALLAVAIPMVEGEILIAEGKIDGGIEQLRAAIRKEDALKYDEPPGWLIPVRHSLGAALMKQQRFAEAEQVYRDDLARLPENGWSLLGLAESLRKQKKNADEIAQTQRKFEKVWAKADLTITTSCLCQPQA